MRTVKRLLPEQIENLAVEDAVDEEEHKDENPISKELKDMLDKAEELDWSYEVYEEEGNGRSYAELFKLSDAGEDFSILVDFKKDDQTETFLRNLRDYVYNFDPDEHAEMWLPERGRGGCPNSIRALIDDADSIKKMCEELLEALERVGTAELTDEQSERNNEIYNAVYEMCKVVAEDENLEWDMYYLGEIAELAANMMVNKGYRVRFPSIVENENGK